MQNMVLNNYSLENTIHKYHQLSTEAHNKKKLEKPILVTRTINGEKQVHIVQNRSEISLWKRVQAYFGFGEASLKNVANVLREKKWDNHSEALNNSLNYIDSKISTLNKTSLVQRIGQIIPLKLVHVLDYNSGVSTTYHPEGSNPEQDENGILDFVHVFPEIGSAYVADGTGHGKVDKHNQLKEQVWDEFNKKFASEYKNTVINDISQIKVFLKDHLLQLSGLFEKKAGTASTFSLAMIVEFEGRKYVVSAHAGDSALIHINRKGHINHITPSDAEHPANKIELSALNGKSPIFIDVRPVQPGDKIFGLTDGILDFLPAKILNSILQKYSPSNGINLLDQLKQAIENPQSKDNSPKKFDPKNKNGSDDISAFLLVVPD
jgi:hypothetical protein